MEKFYEIINYLNELGIPYVYDPEFDHLYAYNKKEYAMHLINPSIDIMCYIRMRPEGDGWFIRKCGICGAATTRKLKKDIKEYLIY